MLTPSPLTPSRTRKNSFLETAKENALNFFVPMRRYSARERILEQAHRLHNFPPKNIGAKKKLSNVFRFLDGGRTKLWCTALRRWKEGAS